MKKARFLIFLVVIQMTLFISGCKWSIMSVTGPNCASSGGTVTIYVEGSCETEANSPSVYGLILQIPNSWFVLSATATAGGYSYNLTENTEYASLYTAEPGHKIWIGTATAGNDSQETGTATVRLSIGDCGGQVKAAAGSYRNDVWTADDPAAEFNFANITEQRYVHSVGCCAWKRQSSPSPTSLLKAVWGSSSNDVFAVGANGTILHYNGTDWSSMSSDTTNNLNGVWGSSGQYVFAVGDKGTILHYNGTDWSAMTSGTTSNLNGVWGSPGYGVFAVGDNENTIMQNIGDVWTSKTLPGQCSSSELFGIWGSGANDIFAVGNFRSFFHYNGSYWQCTQLYGGNMYGVWGNSPTDVFAVGVYINEFWEDHPIAHYDGASWTAMPNDITDSLYGVWGSSGANVFAVGNQGVILHYGGNLWASMRSGTTSSLRCVWGSSGRDVFAVGDNGTILHYGPPIDIYISEDGQCNNLTPCYSTINSAMNEATDGDTLKVAEGTYKEAPVMDKIGKITISGGWNNTFSDKAGTTSIYAPLITAGGGVKLQPNVKVIAPE